MSGRPQHRRPPKPKQNARKKAKEPETFDDFMSGTAILPAIWTDYAKTHHVAKRASISKRKASGMEAAIERRNTMKMPRKCTAKHMR